MANLLCTFIGHKTIRSGAAQSLCVRCDATVYDMPVKIQGDAWRKDQAAKWEAMRNQHTTRDTPSDRH